MSGPLSWRGRRQIAQRLGWGVADQVVSSLGNFLLGVYVARSMGAESLGALGVALVVYAIVVNISRALSTDPLMIRFSAVSKDSWRSAVPSSGGVALLVGVTGGIGCLALGLALKGYVPDSEAGAAFLALGIVLPGLTLQDSWRYAFFAAGEGAKTFVNDSVWTVLLLAVLLVGELTGLSSVAWALLAFGGTATIASVLGAAQARVVPELRDATKWLRDHRDLSTRFLVTNVALGTGKRIRSFVVAATVGLAAAGAIRGGEILIGPIAALLMGVAQVAVPEAARALKRGSRTLLRLCVGLSGVLAVGAFAWGLVVLFVFPFGIGELLLGAVWTDVHVLILGMTVSTTAGCLQIGPSAGLRALGRADKTMRCQLAVSILVIALGGIGAVAWQAPGAIWGTAVASLLGAGIWWRQLTNALREHIDVEATEASAPHGLRANAGGRR